MTKNSKEPSIPAQSDTTHKHFEAEAFRRFALEIGLSDALFFRKTWTIGRTGETRIAICIDVMELETASQLWEEREELFAVVKKRGVAAGVILYLHGHCFSPLVYYE